MKKASFKKIGIIFLLIGIIVCIFMPRDESNEDPRVYIVNGSAPYFSPALAKTHTLMGQLETEERYARVTCESMFSGLEDGEWNGLCSGEYTTLIQTDHRQTDPRFEATMKYLYSKTSLQVSNSVLQDYDSLCKNKGIETFFDLSLNPYRVEMINFFQQNNALDEYRRYHSFALSVNQDIHAFVKESLAMGQDCIVRYDGVHSLWLIKTLEKEGINPIIIDASPEFTAVEKKDQVSKKLLLVAELLEIQ